jgi:hypothetical protein
MAGENVRNVNDLAVENENTAANLLNSSQNLSDQSSTLNKAIDGFLQEIQTG